MTSCVLSCSQLRAGKLSASYFVGCVQPNVFKNEVQMHFVIFKNNFGDKGWNLVNFWPPQILRHGFEMAAMCCGICVMLF